MPPLPQALSPLRGPLLVALSSLSLVSLSGCQGPPRECIQNSDCSLDAICIDGSCQPQAGDGADASDDSSDDASDDSGAPQPGSDAMEGVDQGAPPPDTGEDTDTGEPDAAPDLVEDMEEAPDLCQPGEEVCDGIDNDCDGEVDEDVQNACGGCGPLPEEVCDGLDNDCDGDRDEGCDDDGDGYCDAAMVFVARAEPHLACPLGGGDCDDGAAAIHPGAQEICDGFDNNCAAGLDEGCDDDGDGFCDAQMELLQTPATQALCPGGGGDCDDQDALRNPAQLEICDGLDNDCDGDRDEGCDDDGDGACDAALAFVDSEDARLTCPHGGEDCDDQDAQRAPHLEERCDGRENSCDEDIDEGCDDDGDGYCDAALALEDNEASAALCPHGGGDCDDERPYVNPGSPELCDGVDNDCDGATDQEDEDYSPLCPQQRGVCQGTPQACQEGQLQLCAQEDYQRHAWSMGWRYQHSPPQGEGICDGIDNDCNGVVDEACCAQGEDALVHAWGRDPQVAWTGVESLHVAASPDGSVYATLSMLRTAEGTRAPLLTLNGPWGEPLAQVEPWPWEGVPSGAGIALVGLADRFRVFWVSDEGLRMSDLDLQGAWIQGSIALLDLRMPKPSPEAPLWSAQDDQGRIYLAQHVQPSYRVWRLDAQGQPDGAQQWEHQGAGALLHQLLWHQGRILLASQELHPGDSGQIRSQIAALETEPGLQAPQIITAALGAWDPAWSTSYLGQSLLVHQGALHHYALLQDHQDAPGVLRQLRLSLDSLAPLGEAEDLWQLAHPNGILAGALALAEHEPQLYWRQITPEEQTRLYLWTPDVAQPRELAPHIYKAPTLRALPRGPGSALWLLGSPRLGDRDFLLHLPLDPQGAPLCPSP